MTVGVVIPGDGTINGSISFDRVVNRSSPLPVFSWIIYHHWSSKSKGESWSALNWIVQLGKCKLDSRNLWKGPRDFIWL